MSKTRTVKDSMGELKLPEEALWQAQTQRAVENFRLGGGAMPVSFIRSLARIKGCAAQVNGELKEIGHSEAQAIAQAALRLVRGDFEDQFPVDRWQTGSGTSTNMNLNEVIASLAAEESGLEIHPNDMVNRGQSSNDVIPSALQLSCLLLLQRTLKPALERLIEQVRARAAGWGAEIKTGRTHLMDAMPVSLAQEAETWAVQLEGHLPRLQQVTSDLSRLSLGGTAVGTGVNCHEEFPGAVASLLSDQLKLEIGVADNPSSRMAGQESALAASALLQGVAVSLIKICNDLRWMASGPNAGLAELRLPELQPGSSIMPGKVNPVIPEAVLMAATQVQGLHTANTVAAQSGNFQLNVMLPLLACNLLDSSQWLARCCDSLSDQVFEGLQVNTQHLASMVQRNPILVTALNDRIGYDKAAAIAKRAFIEGRSVIEVAEEETGISRPELESLLDPNILNGNKSFNKQ